MDIRDVLDFQLEFLREEELKSAIKQRGQLVEVAAGTTILNEGSYVKTVPLLLSGLAKVVKVEAGKEMLLYYIYPLESCIVSIHCGINDLKSHVRAIAEEPTTALLLPASEVANWQSTFSSFNEFVMELYQKRFFNVLDAFNALAFQRLDERLLSFLRAKSETLGSKEVRSTHQELSDELGTARETISRILKKLEADDRLTLHRGWIEIH